MIMYVTTWPIVSRNVSAACGTSYTTSPMQSFGDKKFEVKTVLEVSAAFERHIKTVEKTGQPAMVFAGHQSGRKINGFDGLDLRCYVNTDKVD